MSCSVMANGHGPPQQNQPSAVMPTLPEVSTDPLLPPMPCRPVIYFRKNGIGLGTLRQVWKSAIKLSFV